MLAGTQIPAGLGFALAYPSLDFETYSEAGCVWIPNASGVGGKWGVLPAASKKGLPTVGAAAYAMHPSTEVLCASYDLRDGLGKRHWRPGLMPPVDLFLHVRNGGLISGWNVGFEQWIWNYVCTRRYGWPPVDPLQLVDAMGKARAFSLPGKLEEAARVAGTTPKNPEGARLLTKFSMPRNTTKHDLRTRIRPDEDPVDGPALYSYNHQDVDAEAEVAWRTPEMTEQEQRYWRNDQAINLRGVQIDTALVDACIAIINRATEKYTAELVALAGCKPTEIAQLQGWLHAHGVHLDGLDEETVEKALETDLPPHCRRALEIRALVGSASVKKVFAMKNQVTPFGRLHDLYSWHGARTGRPTGNGPQPTNLPKAGPDVHRCGWAKGKPLFDGGCGRYHGAHTFICPWCAKLRPPTKAAEWSPEAMEDAIVVILSASLELVQWFFGDAMLAIAGVLRGIFIAKDGHTLISSDFTAIEGVVIAALAGEQWRLDVYREKAQGFIYIESAARAFGVSVEEMLRYKEEMGQHHPLRDKGKRMELGLGFGGWINALRSDQIRYEGTDEELKEAILKWRGASPMLVNLWGGQKIRNPDGRGWVDKMFGLEGAAVSAVIEPGQIFSARGIRYLMHDDVLYCRLLSGRCLAYHRPRLEESEEPWRGLALSFEGWNSNPKSGPLGWQRMYTYAGKLAENVVQATARDLQMHAIEQLELRGYPIVLHTYDEVVAEVPEGFGSVEELEAIMVAVPEWARDWPIKAAGGWIGRRYRKG